jgi:hypothetical protein
VRTSSRVLRAGGERAGGMGRRVQAAEEQVSEIHFPHGEVATMVTHTTWDYYGKHREFSLSSVGIWGWNTLLWGLSHAL